MRKELALSLAGSVVMHVLLFVCFPGGRYEEQMETEEMRMRREYPVVLLPMPKGAKTIPEPVPVVSDSQHAQQEVDTAQMMPLRVEKEAPVESLVRLGEEPSLSALDSLRMAAVRECIERRPAVVDSSEQRRLRIKRNFEEIKKDIMAWQKGKGKTPSLKRAEVLLDGEGPQIGGGVSVGFPTDWDGVKRAGRRASLAGKALVSKEGIEAIFDLSPLEIDIMVVVWTLEPTTPRDVYWKVTGSHRASYTDIAEAMEGLTLRWKTLLEMGKGVYASAIRREDVVRFLGRMYIREGKRDRSRLEILEKLLEVLKQ